MPTPIRQRSVYAYCAVGAVIAAFAFSVNFAWDWCRAVVVIAAIANMGISAQIALYYTNCVYDKIPRSFRFFGNSPTAYWLGALGMMILAAALIVGTIARAGQDPATPLNLPLLAVALSLLTGWGVLVLNSLHKLGRGLDG